MLGDTSGTFGSGREEMKRSTDNGEEVPHAKRKKTQTEDLKSALVQLQTDAQDQETVIERPQSTQVTGDLGNARRDVLSYFFWSLNSRVWYSYT